MSIVYFKPTRAQQKSLGNAIKNKGGFSLVFTKAQVREASQTHFEGSLPIPLNAMQLRKLNNAKNTSQGTSIVYSPSAVAKHMKKSGGFVPLIPMLLSMLPGLLGAAPQILDGVKSGYENVGKLVGIGKGLPALTPNAIPTNSPATILVEHTPVLRGKRGASLQLAGAGVNKKKGSSLKIFGEGFKDPNSVTY